jgi:hypothetical protein
VAFQKGVSGNPGGRPAGSANKVTPEIRTLSRSLFDAHYWQRVRGQLRDGTLHPSIETKLLSYAYGEPRSLDAAGPGISVQIGFLQTMLPDDTSGSNGNGQGIRTATRLPLSDANERPPS